MGFLPLEPHSLPTTEDIPNIYNYFIQDDSVARCWCVDVTDRGRLRPILKRPRYDEALTDSVGDELVELGVARGKGKERESDRRPSFYMLGSVPVLKTIVTGLVVGTIRYEKKNVYLVDDGTAVLECVQWLRQLKSVEKAKPEASTSTSNTTVMDIKDPPPSNPNPRKKKPPWLCKPSQSNPASASSASQVLLTNAKKAKRPKYLDVDGLFRVGTLVEVMGQVESFGDSRQLVIEKIDVLQDINLESKNHLEIARLHREKYSKPWSASSVVRARREACDDMDVGASQDSTMYTELDSKNISTVSSTSLTSTMPSPSQLRASKKISKRTLSRNVFRTYVYDFMIRGCPLSSRSNNPNGSFAPSPSYDASPPSPSQQTSARQFSKGSLMSDPDLRNMAERLVKKEWKESNPADPPSSPKPVLTGGGRGHSSIIVPRSSSIRDASNRDHSGRSRSNRTVGGDRSYGIPGSSYSGKLPGGKGNGYLDDLSMVSSKTDKLSQDLTATAPAKPLSRRLMESKVDALFKGTIRHLLFKDGSIVISERDSSDDAPSHRLDATSSPPPPDNQALAKITTTEEESYEVVSEHNLGPTLVRIIRDRWENQHKWKRQRRLRPDEGKPGTGNLRGVPLSQVLSDLWADQRWCKVPEIKVNDVLQIVERGELQRIADNLHGDLWRPVEI